jgi:hypothetical protein
MRLDELPLDVLVSQLPQHILSIYDFYSLLSTNRLFYDLYGSFGAPPYALPPTSSSPDGQHLMQPHPLLLIAGAARQIGNWAGASKENDDELYECLLRGNDGLLELAGKVARMTLGQIRELYELKYSLLNPLSRLFDLENGRLEDDDSNLIFVKWHPESLILNIWIYDELFHGYPDQALGRLPGNISTIELRTKFRWLTMCMPDRNNSRHPDYERMNAGEDVPLASETQHQQMMQFSESFSASTNPYIALWAYYDIGFLKVGTTDIEENGNIFMEGIRSEEITPTLRGERRKLFMTIAFGLGPQSLFWLLPGYMEANHGEIELVLKDIRDAVDRVDDTKMITRRDTTGPMNGWMGWFGIGIDVQRDIAPGTFRLIPEWDRLRYNTESTDEL